MWVDLYESVGGVIVGFNYLLFWNFHTLFRTVHVLVEMLKKSNLSRAVYCTVSLSYIDSEKAVIKELYQYTVLTSFKVKKQKINAVQIA